MQHGKEKEKQRTGKEMKETKRTKKREERRENTTPFGVTVMRSQYHTGLPSSMARHVCQRHLLLIPFVNLLVDRGCKAQDQPFGGIHLQASHQAFGL